MGERELLRQLFNRAVEAALPKRWIAEILPPPPAGRTVIVGAGKAAAGMAEAVEQVRGSGIDGAVAVPAGTTCACRRIECIEAMHPVPDERSVQAARRMRELVSGLGAEDQVIALISGGGSALLCDPVEGISLEDKQALTNALLRCGATIREINCVRQSVSRIKGGRLAALAAPAPVHTLLVSDVPGDDPALIASGPTVGSPFQPGDARAVLERYGIAVPGALDPAEDHEPPVTEAQIGDRCRHTIICSPMLSLRAAADAARDAGITPVILGDRLEGEARELGTVLAGIALGVRHWGEPAPPPVVLLSGGEATVTIEGTAGRGGRNMECALSLALALEGAARIHALCADTDGIDGTEPDAGAIVDPTTLERARAGGIDARDALAGHDAGSFFEALGDRVTTGPTGTNVNDFRAILVR